MNYQRLIEDIDRVLAEPLLPDEVWAGSMYTHGCFCLIGLLLNHEIGFMGEKEELPYGKMEERYEIDIHDFKDPGNNLTLDADEIIRSFGDARAYYSVAPTRPALERFKGFAQEQLKTSSFGSLDPKTNDPALWQD